MSVRTRRRSPLLLVLVVVAVAVLGGQRVVGPIRDLIAGRTGDYAAAPGADEVLGSCTADDLLVRRRCGDLPVLVIDAARMPFIARNIQHAWAAGALYVLHRDSPARTANYTESCRRGFKPQYGGSCDEYPFASTTEGGAGARTEEVPLAEQNCQGGTVSRAYQNQRIANGDAFLVVISHPDSVARRPFAGDEDPEDSSCQG